MDIGDEDSLEYGNGECRSYPSPHPSSDWQCNHVANWSARLIPGASPMPICKDDIVGRSCTSVSMAGSFHPMIWQHGQSSQPMAFNELDMHSNNSVATESNGVVPGAEVGWVLPHSLSSFPVDTASIERATRLSSFYEGIVADAMNPFSILHDANATNPIPHENVLIMARTSMDHTNGINGRKNGREESCFDEAQGIAMLVDNSDVAELLGGSKENQPMMDIGNVPFSAEDLESKKRKRGCQGVESERTNQDSQQFDEVAKISGEMPNKPKRNPCPTTSNAMAKLVKQNSEASDPLKGEYMHFRARRGQATNSHSLAERVRREKISERMRLLQDLVPSCSKATVKAVMLDEIINYVKSLQQQVEFLSMKLATVSPSLNFNLDKLLLKDMLMVQSNPSTTMGCSADMPTAYPFRETEQTAYQLRAPIIGNSPDAARTVASQIPTSNLSFSNLSSFSRP